MEVVRQNSYGITEMGRTLYTACVIAKTDVNNFVDREHGANKVWALTRVFREISADVVDSRSVFLYFWEDLIGKDRLWLDGEVCVNSGRDDSIIICIILMTPSTLAELTPPRNSATLQKLNHVQRRTVWSKHITIHKMSNFKCRYSLRYFASMERHRNQC